MLAQSKGSEDDAFQPRKAGLRHYPNMKKIIAPSLLAADFSCLAQDITRLENCGIKELHLDIMDGHFVENISFGAGLIKSLRPHCNLYFDAHLMVTEPDKLIAPLQDAGVNSVAVHAEACLHLYHTLETIKKADMDTGVVLNPATDFRSLEYVAADNLLGRVVIMSVEPGFGGQSYLPMSTKKIAALAQWRAQNDYSFTIQVDGGVNEKTLPEIIAAGADDLVIGSAMFKNRDIEGNAQKFFALLEK